MKQGKYIVVSENEIVKAEMERPSFSAWEIINPCVNKDRLIKPFQEHCLSLPRIAIQGKHNWKVWQSVELDKDFTCGERCFGVTGDFCITVAIPIQPTPECNHEPLVDTGIGYYHCPACNEGWTYEECRSKQPTPEGEKVFGEWQLCPKCNGDGNLARYNSPSIISTDSSLICDVCNGAKILARPLLTTDNTQTK